MHVEVYRFMGGRVEAKGQSPQPASVGMPPAYTIATASAGIEHRASGPIVTSGERRSR